MDYALLALTISLTAVAQIVQKLASRQFAGHESPGSAVWALFRSRSFWLAAMLLALALLAWLVTLSLVEVSKAYPLLALSFVFTALLSSRLLNEEIKLRRWVGIGLITAGAALMLVA
jgi:undecaprenyl phosphate-alpha-L-ara4N flippase subunit ArnE